jgi:Leucine-rich repeat (LRR) protein
MFDTRETKTGTFHPRGTWKHIAGLLMVLLAAGSSGCGGSKSPAVSNGGPQPPELLPPRIAERPDTDVLDAAFKQHNGNVEQALDSLVLEVDRKSLIVRNAAGKIEAVDLSGMSLKTAGLKHLLAFKDTLQRIALNRVYVTDEALASLPQLRKLELNQTPVTDAGLAHLRQATRLRELSLKGTAIGDAGVAHLAALKELRFLSLSWTRVNDAGLRHLAELKELNTLILDDTAVTDAGLQHLAGLKKLLFVHVTGTNVTGNGIAKLRRSLTRVDVRGP